MVRRRSSFTLIELLLASLVALIVFVPISRGMLRQRILADAAVAAADAYRAMSRCHVADLESRYMDQESLSSDPDSVISSRPLPFTSQEVRDAELQEIDSRSIGARYQAFRVDVREKRP